MSERFSVPDLVDGLSGVIYLPSTGCILQGRKNMKRSLAASVAMLMLRCLVSTAFAQLPRSDIFDIRPPRVRVATVEETIAAAPLNYHLPSVPADSVVPQEELLLTEQDPLVAVFPVRDFQHSHNTIYEIGGVEVDGFDISIDFYQFISSRPGANNSIYLPLEQTVSLGTLPAGEYDVRLRYWTLNPEDQFGFDPSTIPEFIPPPPGTLVASPGRHYTQSNFSFTVVPEPSSCLLAWIGMGLFAILRLR